jgi:hypothetical protein
MVWKSRFLACALACFLAEEIDWIEGGASGGNGVERPLVDCRVSVCLQASMPEYSREVDGYLEMPEAVVSTCK